MAKKKAPQRLAGAEESCISPEQEAIIQWFRTVKFRKNLLGGVDEAAMWKKLEELYALYEAAIRAERTRYNVLLERQTGSLPLDTTEVDSFAKGSPTRGAVTAKPVTERLDKREANRSHGQVQLLLVAAALVQHQGHTTNGNDGQHCNVRCIVQHNAHIRLSGISIVESSSHIGRNATRDSSFVGIKTNILAICILHRNIILHSITSVIGTS